MRWGRCPCCEGEWHAVGPLPLLPGGVACGGAPAPAARGWGMRWGPAQWGPVGQWRG